MCKAHYVHIRHLFRHLQTSFHGLLIRFSFTKTLGWQHSLIQGMPIFRYRESFCCVNIYIYWISYKHAFIDQITYTSNVTWQSQWALNFNSHAWHLFTICMSIPVSSIAPGLTTAVLYVYKFCFKNSHSRLFTVSCDCIENIWSSEEKSCLAPF